MRRHRQGGELRVLQSAVDASDTPTLTAARSVPPHEGEGWRQMYRRSERVSSATVLFFLPAGGA
jgi:hypothetical protein